MISSELADYLNYNTYYAKMEENRVCEGLDKLVLPIPAGEIFDELVSADSIDLIQICQTGPDKMITTANIPQISNIDDGTLNLIELLIDNKDYGMSYIDIGKKFLGEGKKDAAYLKYGENHAKLARELDLAFIVNADKAYVYLSPMAYILKRYPSTDQKTIIAKQMLSIPIIRYLIKRGQNEKINVVEVLEHFLSHTTAVRRKASIKQILGYLDASLLNALGESRNNIV